MRTSGRQAEVVVRPGLGAQHQFPHDDGEAEDVALGRPVEGQAVQPQELRGDPEEICSRGKKIEAERS